MEGSWEGLEGDKGEGEVKSFYFNEKISSPL